MMFKMEASPKSDLDDLDSLIKELEEKGKKKQKEETRKPFEKPSSYSHNDRKENKIHESFNHQLQGLEMDYMNGERERKKT